MAIPSPVGPADNRVGSGRAEGAHWAPRTDRLRRSQTERSSSTRSPSAVSDSGPGPQVEVEQHADQRRERGHDDRAREPEDPRHEPVVADRGPIAPMMLNTTAVMMKVSTINPNACQKWPGPGSTNGPSPRCRAGSPRRAPGSRRRTSPRGRSPGHERRRPRDHGKRRRSRPAARCRTARSPTCTTRRCRRGRRCFSLGGALAAIAACSTAEMIRPITAAIAPTSRAAPADWVVTSISWPKTTSVVVSGANTPPRGRH